eukprot:2878747-Prymnesium_polylepis.1
MVAPGDGIGRYARPAVPSWPMAYDAPCGGSGATRAPRCRGWHEVRVDERPTAWPMAYGAPWGGSGRYARPTVPPWLARGTSYVSMRQRTNR